MITPRTVSGTLELLPHDQMVFQHMFDVIRSEFEKFGFLNIETPVFELKDVLLTKSGGETEKQVYFVQSTGSLQQGHEIDLALRFDLTVPLARYVAEHERDLSFPFRRYQMQRVYRGERAQRGRSREFYQCDIDVIGKDKLSPAYDAELPAIIVRIFEKLQIGEFTIHFSNRKILLGFLAHHGVREEEAARLMLREIDKIDKIGAEKVRHALISLGLPETAAAKVLELISSKGSNAEILKMLQALGITDALFLQGFDELSLMVTMLQALGVPENRVRLNLSIARGLDYYTGTVYETMIDEHPEFGSICSGGRYDDLASHYTKSTLPGVGISIGLTRLFDQLHANGLLPAVPNTVQILIAQLDPVLSPVYLALATELRNQGYHVDTWLEPAKLDKQIKFADKSAIPIVLLVGSNEQKNDTVILKNMVEKTQQEVARGQLMSALGHVLGA